MRHFTIALVTLVLLAGCIEAPLDTEDAFTGPEAAESRETTVMRTFQFQGATALLTVGSDTQFDRWDLPIPAPLQSVTIVAEWEVPGNGVAVDLVDRDGRALRTAGEPGATRVEETFTDTGRGPFQVQLMSDGTTTVQDDVVITVEATWRVATGEDADVTPAGGMVVSEVTTERREDGWIAFRTFTATGDAAPHMTADVEMRNGRVTASAGDADAAVVAVTAWARGATESAAREGLRDIRVDAFAGDGTVRAHAEAPRWQHRGAQAEVTLPRGTTLSGDVLTSNGRIAVTDLSLERATVATSNGRIVLEGVEVRDLEARTSNGRIEGDATMAGDVAFRTSNGRIQVALTPVASGALHADTSNGRVRLMLHEDADVAYAISASTSNSKVTEDMREADLRGSDRSATLETRDSAGRAIRVAGSVSTSNGGIHFVGT